ncbi:MAG: hypothetical protein M3332_03610 [Actinomycetota bacterium]|nr:hypothetical protein [Actinomycetota bacterium]
MSDVDSGGELAVLRGHDAGVRGVAWSRTVSGWLPRQATEQGPGFGVHGGDTVRRGTSGMW